MVNWRDATIAKSQAITDAWEIVKAFAGRAAEPILFLCMVADIIEILPGVVLSPAVFNVVLGTQAITLDVAGLALSTLAEQAESQGAAQAAKRARRTGYCLIGLMLVTVALVTTALLWPTTKVYTDQADKALILARVVAAVAYGYVIHGLRRYDAAPAAQATTPAQATPAAQVDDLKAWIGAQLAEQAERFERRLSALSEQLAALSTPPASEQVGDDEPPTDCEQVVDNAGNIVDIAGYRNEQPNVSTKMSATRAPQPRGDAQQKALRVLKKHPGIGPSELARKAQISRSYASRILAQVASK